MTKTTVQWLFAATACLFATAAWGQASTQGYTPAPKGSTLAPREPDQSRLPLADPSQFSDNPGDTSGQAPGGVPGGSAGNAGAQKPGKSTPGRRGPESGR